MRPWPFANRNGPLCVTLLFTWRCPCLSFGWRVSLRSRSCSSPDVVQTSPVHASPRSRLGSPTGGLTAGAEGTAQRIAIRERQHIDLNVAVTLAHEKTSQQGEPQSGSCPTGPLIRVVLEGSFPAQNPAVKAEEVYADPLSRHMGICARTYLSTLPALRSHVGTLYVPGTASTGE